MKGPRTHLDIIGLQKQAALCRPEILERQDQILKGARLRHDSFVLQTGPEPTGRPLSRQ